MSKYSLEILKPGYSVPYPFGGTNNVEIKPTANAWWSNQSKVHQFLLAIGTGCTIEEACAYIDITVKQYKYFQSLHPDFKELRNAYSLIPIIKAKQAVVRGLDDPKFALRYLERKLPGEFSSRTIKKNAGLRRWEQERKGKSILTKEQIEKINMIAGIKPVPNEKNEQGSV
jgi:hypothetical protein